MPVNAVPSLHLGTPDVAAGFRVLRFLRTKKGESARLLITRTVVDPLARTSRAYGARQLNNPATDHADALTVTALSAGTLKLHTADGDVTLSLGDIGGRPLWSQNAQGTVSALIYEPAAAAGRPHVATEQPAGGTARIREQYVYALANDTRWQALNLAGAMTELSNNAGISRTLRVSLTGQTLLSEQRLLKPAAGLPDWKVNTENDTEDALVVCATYDATGTTLSTTNAANVSTITAYDISASVMETRLRYAGQGAAPLTEVVTLRDVVRRADGAVLSQTAGSGVVEAYEYDRRTQYLTRHSVVRLAGHPSGALLISDLHYTYDPVGNILTLEDKGADPHWHDNQQATGLRLYTYDTCYRLTSATGRERAPVARYSTDPSGGNVWKPYSEAYTYDDGDNLTLISHLGGASDRRRELSVAAGSNRALPKEHSLTPELGFLVGGLQRQLSDGRALAWYADNQLRQVNPVMRAEGQGDDTEAYHYADGGTRTRKIHTVSVSGGMQTTITTYAGGCEVRQRLLTGQEAPQKHVVATEGGGVRVVEDLLSCKSHLRYSFSDQLGSIGGEMDETGRVTAREEYAPYGGTVGRDEEAEEVSDLMQRTYRYSGKEMDTTGLIYYGWRYYQPELCRWLSADPSGLSDGLNLFEFVKSNPISHSDGEGLFTLNPVVLYRTIRRERRASQAYRHMAEGRHWLESNSLLGKEQLSRKRDFDEQFKRNLKITQNLIDGSFGSGSLNVAEQGFYKRFQNLEFELYHFNRANLEANGKMKLYSRIEGEKRNLINPVNTDNTDQLDIEWLGTHDFTFFSLGVIGAQGKTSSAFAPAGSGYKYTIGMEDAGKSSYFKFGHFALNDTLNYDTPQASDERVWALITGDKSFLDHGTEGSELLKIKQSYPDAVKSDVSGLKDDTTVVAPRYSIFSLNDLKSQLAYHLIIGIRALSERTQNKLLSTNSPQGFDELISTLYRPQVLIPKKFTTRAFVKTATT